MYKARHHWEGKFIHGELCKNFKFDYTNKWYMHNTETVLENEMHKLHWDSEIQTDRLISARRLHLVIVKNKKKCPNSGLCHYVGLQSKTDRRRKERNNYLDFTRLLKVTVIPIIIGVLSTDKGTGGLGNKRTSGVNPNYSIVMIGQKTEKSPGDLRRLAVTQNPVENHQLVLVWKTLKWV